eukprot:TRINITY_DN6409_c0_g1_i1.p1 TRINITY_DN6409_c0_g1~~TRINITY_DN6409_c0_g1_i1.p1  ORF type:complete len:245 (-),score=62.93 TRINITY_DN6409_c0_g1_i1:50-784(-)
MSKRVHHTPSCWWKTTGQLERLEYYQESGNEEEDEDVDYVPSFTFTKRDRKKRKNKKITKEKQSIIQFSNDEINNVLEELKENDGLYKKFGIVMVYEIAQTMRKTLQLALEEGSNKIGSFPLGQMPPGLWEFLMLKDLHRRPKKISENQIKRIVGGVAQYTPRTSYDFEEGHLPTLLQPPTEVWWIRYHNNYRSWFRRVVFSIDEETERVRVKRYEQITQEMVIISKDLEETEENNSFKWCIRV